MRGKLLNYEQLVKENKRVLLADETKIKEIELRLEKRQMKLVENKRKKKVVG